MKFDIDQSIEILSRTPKTLQSLLSGLSSEWTDPNEGPDTWSPFDVVGHLIHGEKTDWVPRAKIIMSRGDKHFEPFDRFAMFEASRGKNLNQLLIEFQELRDQGLKELKDLNIRESDLEKEGIHPYFGNITLRNLLSTWVTHDLNHIYQIVRVMAKLYKEETGPWPEYIRILNE